MLKYEGRRNEMNRQQARENAMIYLYQMLLKAPLENSEILGDETLLNEDFLTVISTALSDIRDLRQVLDNQLDDWDFERLGFIERSILILSLAESKTLQTPKQVLIDEAVILSKKFCDEDTYKLINATLDRILQ